MTSVARHYCPAYPLLVAILLNDRKFRDNPEQNLLNLKASLLGVATSLHGVESQLQGG